MLCWPSAGLYRIQINPALVVTRGSNGTGKGGGGMDERKLGRRSIYAYTTTIHSKLVGLSLNLVSHMP